MAYNLRNLNKSDFFRKHNRIGRVVALVVYVPVLTVVTPYAMLFRDTCLTVYPGWSALLRYIFTKHEGKE